MEDSGGLIQPFVTLNEGALQKWGSEVSALLEPGGIWIDGSVNGTRHAEQVLVDYAKSSGRKIVGLGASNTFCSACSSMLLQEVGQQFLGQP